MANHDDEGDVGQPPWWAEALEWLVLGPLVVIAVVGAAWLLARLFGWLFGGPGDA